MEIELYHNAGTDRYILVIGDVCIYLGEDYDPYEHSTEDEKRDYMRADAEALRKGVWGPAVNG